MKKKNFILFKIYNKCPLRWGFFFLYYLFQAIIPYLYSYIIAIILDKIIDYNIFQFKTIWFLFLSATIFAINTTIYKWGPLLYDFVTFKLRMKFQKEFFSKLSKFDVLYFQKQKNLEKNSFAENAIGFDFFNYGSSILFFIISVFTLIIASISLLYYSLFIFLITIIAAVCLCFLKKYIMNKERIFNDSLKKYELELNYYKRIFENKNALFEFKIYNLFNEYSKKIIDTETLIKKKTNQFAKKQSLLWTIFYLIQISFNFLVTLILINIVKNKTNPTIGLLYFGLQTFNNFLNAFDDRLNDIISLKISKKYINDYYEIINLSGNYSNNVILNPKKEIMINTDNLSFSYDSKSPFTLKNINIKIPENKTIAILGENGSGKSSLINMILKTYYNNLCQYSKNIFENQNIGAIFQDYYKYSLTLRQNILLGDLSKEYSDDEIIQTFVYLNCDNILNKVSLDDYLGDSYNLGGKNISEGEWQKVNLCKVFIKKDRELYVFDEPTSSLDPKTEYELYNNIKKYCNNKTTILISHRIGFAKIADYIYVLDNGKIIEEGTHNALIKKNGKYASLYHEQIKYYDECFVKGEENV